ncbi:MAG TPA: PAS domain-containing protein [Polyangiaceae bacterium]|nr:PAS domain-containing protein [Polyangiaceae bacterium]
MKIPVRVLIVEDVEDDAALMALELKEGGYEPAYERVQTAAEMNEALDRGPWDVVLSDHHMPRFSAITALQMLLDRGLDTPFIVVSGSIGESVVVTLMKAGAYDYVQKDAIEELVPAVRSALLDAQERAESRRAIVALRESEERFALAVRGSRDGLWDWNITSGQTYFSARFKEMLGFDERELDGPIEAFFELVHDDDRGPAREALRRHLEEHAPCDVELRARTKSGQVGWFLFRGQALWDDAGRATRMAGSLSDVTARKRAEEALKQQLELTQRQREAIRVLSTPLIEVWDGVLMVPVLGTLDPARAQEMTQSLLGAVSRTGCHDVIIDLTGVTSIDGATADHVIRIVDSIRLLGARGIVVGIRPQVARAIVSSGVDLSRVTTLGNLRDALAYCLRRPG